MLHPGDGLELPVDVVTQVIALLAKRGAGKTHSAAVLVEEMVHVGAQVVVLDPLGAWWGLRSAVDGKQPGLPFAVLGGDHGDLRLDPSAGGLVADVVASEPALVVVDLSGFDTRADQCRFVTDFCDRLYRRNRKPLHVVMEEADEFAPERAMPGEQKMLGTVQRLVRRGRQRGIGVTLISQRSAALSKGVLTQADILLALRTTAPHDQRAIKEWISTKGVDEQRDEVLESLASLPTGTAWVWAPEMDLLNRCHFRPRHTFDSSATPRLGDTVIEPTAFASVDLEALRKRMSPPVEPDDDSPETRSTQERIAKLEDALAEANARLARTKPQVQRVEVPVPVPHTPSVEAIDQLLSSAQSLTRQVERLRTELVDLPSTPPLSAPSQADAVASEPAEAGPSRAGSALKAGARRLLTTVARHPVPLTKTQLATLAGFAPKGGTYQTYLSTLRREGLIEIDDGVVRPTPLGIARAGLDSPTPVTTAEVLDLWRRSLKRGARHMLDQLITIYPRATSKTDLAAALEMTATGGTFQTYLSTLRRNGLAEVTGDQVRASSSLFLADQ